MRICQERLPFATVHDLNDKQTDLEFASDIAREYIHAVQPHSHLARKDANASHSNAKPLISKILINSMRCAKEAFSGCTKMLRFSSMLFLPHVIYVRIYVFIYNCLYDVYSQYIYKYDMRCYIYNHRDIHTYTNVLCLHWCLLGRFASVTQVGGSSANVQPSGPSLCSCGRSDDGIR